MPAKTGPAGKVECLNPNTGFSPVLQNEVDWLNRGRMFLAALEAFISRRFCVYIQFICRCQSLAGKSRFLPLRNAFRTFPIPKTCIGEDRLKSSLPCRPEIKPFSKNQFMKRIISCSDGTWNQPGTKDRGIEVKTNVAKMYECICHTGASDIKQVKLYDEGVGTGYSWNDRLLSGAAGAGIDKKIKDVYEFFVLNYERGDEIYLFGFSRGAYTARSIAGFIRNCGILKKEYIHLVDKAYAYYRDRNDYTSPDSDLMKSFKAAYCVEAVTPIHFIGVWDTVGALGIPLPWYKLYNKERYKFHDVKLSSYVRHAYHALAVDERRVLFSPTLWEKSDSVKSDPEHPQKLEQRWFAGVHSNVGGGYLDCTLSNCCLQWLMDKAQEAGLCYHEPPLIKETEYDKGELRNSYTPAYWFWRSQWRKIDLADANSNQTIDDSVWVRYRDGKWKYRPKNLKRVEVPTESIVRTVNLAAPTNKF
jgi:uncharacterized protein (DUF2235 family)